MKLIFLDTETTGLDFHKNGIIQISGIIDINGEIKEEFDFRVRPFLGDFLSMDALKITGMTKEKLLEFPIAENVYHQLVCILDKYVDRYNKADKFFMVGQNTKFDYDFLNEWFKKNGNEYFYAYIDYHIIDLVTITAMLQLAGRISVPNMKLETVAKAFQMDFRAHDSLEDVKVTRKIFYKYLGMIK